jgi:hypothetical protein
MVRLSGASIGMLAELRDLLGVAKPESGASGG